MADKSEGVAAQSETLVELPDELSPLDAALQQTQVYFGHPAADEAEGEGEGDLEGQPSPDDEDSKPTLEAEEEGEKPEEKPTKLKYKNHEEAEKGAKEAERAMHEAKAEAKALKEESVAVKAEIQELRAAIEAFKKSPDTKQAEEQAAEKPVSKKETASRVAKALKAMGDLDVDDPEYHEKVGELWVEAGFGAKEAPDPALMEKVVAEQVRQALEAQRAEDAVKTSEQAAVDYANKAAGKAGLDMKPGSADHKLFWLLKGEAPRGIPFDEQIAHVVKEVRKIRGPVSTELKAKADSAQKENRVLGRGSSAVDITPGRQQQNNARPITLSEALDSIQRRI
jgi:hypothetical protein